MLHDTMVKQSAVTDQRPLDLLLAQYALSHQHPLNEKIHLVCVPLIVWTILALIWRIQPIAALICSGLCLGYYWQLSRKMALWMATMLLLMLGGLLLIPMALVLPLALTVFVLAWIGQFIGHHIEGKKPSFLDDIRFLLIGPLFVLAVLFRRAGWSY